LLGRANEIGHVVMTKFTEWQAKYHFIGNARGLGAMCAIEFVKDQITKEPDPTTAKSFSNACIENGVVLMSAGIYSNVIRILSPLIITNELLDKGLTIMEEQLEKMNTKVKART
jgi:4-aminobutyrate aminotransferase / (S)-3-amino-2-methylpropionate transaminase / 5-aminovalerate transaminase